MTRFASARPWLAAAVAAWACAAHAQTADVPLQTLPTVTPPAAPVTGTLANGVDFSVNVGTAWSSRAAQGVSYYGFYPRDGVQTWTFSEPVDLEFLIGGFQGLREGVVLPAGTQCTVPTPNLGVTWDAATHTVIHDAPYNNPSGGVLVRCTLANTSSLAIDGSGLGPADYGRGLNSLQVTRLAAVSAAFSGVPTTLTVGQTQTGTLTCTNNGPGAASAADCVPSITSGGATLSALSCTPSTPVATLASGDAIVCTFDLTGTATGPVALLGTASGGAGPNATHTTTASLTVTATPAAVPTLGALGLGLLGAALGATGLHRRRAQRARQGD